MTLHETAVILLAAGKGTRMKSDLPKVLHRLAGKALVNHALDAAGALGPSQCVVVVGPGMEDVAAAVAPRPTAIQAEQRGTADAVLAAREALAGFGAGGDATVLVLYGDTPMIEADTLGRMIEARQGGAAVVVLGFRPRDPAEYGRLELDGAGALSAIVEFREADEEQRKIDLCNSGVMAIGAGHVWDLLDRVGADNAKGEYYLTDIVALARDQGLACAVVEGEESEVLGINSRGDLAAAEAAWQRARRARAMDEGATLIDPSTVWFAHDTQIGRDVTIGPSVFFGPGVSVADGAEINAFCHLEGVAIGLGASVGPFARLRPGAKLGSGARVGNFVEVKNAVLGAGAKANHLSYIGDAEVGAGANIGAGTITCNYDGYLKHRTEIGENAFIGSNTALVAPVSVGKGALIGAGSTIIKDVPDDAVAVARGRQVTLEGGARDYRERKLVVKAEKLEKRD
ncbi:MAG: bifunctional UDP-N-acetylglucosamine diphosphorylase/glucosamine-1-phosphate N-acetyltransferase GlmU [Alphaproteobacteria bacterium]|nr:bifunctional UDP-N-acetylglucosamine diphosphorylase/glucosamine-1-phosphate N-acetyltransferase GlmU [Alphaproteobacteria bacterium]